MRVSLSGKPLQCPIWLQNFGFLLAFSDGVVQCTSSHDVHLDVCCQLGVHCKKTFSYRARWVSFRIRLTARKLRHGVQKICCFFFPRRVLYAERIGLLSSIIEYIFHFAFILFNNGSCENLPRHYSIIQSMRSFVLPSGY